MSLAARDTWRGLCLRLCLRLRLDHLGLYLYLYLYLYLCPYLHLRLGLRAEKLLFWLHCTLRRTAAAVAAAGWLDVQSLGWRQRGGAGKTVPVGGKRAQQRAEKGQMRSAGDRENGLGIQNE